MTGNNLHSKILMAIRPAKRRAVAEVISSLLLVVITVVGAVILTTFLDETFVAGSSSLAGSETTARSLQLLKYDTRDSAALMLLQTADNKFGDGLLLGAGAASIDSVPEDDGTEFLVIQIKNRSINPTHILDIRINGVLHDWDPLTSGIDFSATPAAVVGAYPSDGTFSIALVPEDPATDPSIQKSSATIEEGQIVNIFIKLGPDDTDIDLNKSVRILLNIGAPSPVEFIIEGGNAQ